MIKFLPLRADVQNNLFENAQYLPFVLDLLFKNRHLIENDFFPKDDGELLDYIIQEINYTYPWFIVGIINNKPIGASWITHFHKASHGKYHSCQIHACIDREFWGTTSLYAIDELIKFIHMNTGVVRFQMEIPEFNKVAVSYAKRAGFQQEGLIRCAAVKNGLPLNHILLGKVLFAQDDRLNCY